MSVSSPVQQQQPQCGAQARVLSQQQVRLRDLVQPAAVDCCSLRSCLFRRFLATKSSTSSRLLPSRSSVRSYDDCLSALLENCFLPEAANPAAAGRGAWAGGRESVSLPSLSALRRRTDKVGESAATCCLENPRARAKGLALRAGPLCSIATTLLSSKEVEEEEEALMTAAGGVEASEQSAGGKTTRMSSSSLSTCLCSCSISCSFVPPSAPESMTGTVRHSSSGIPLLRTGVRSAGAASADADADAGSVEPLKFSTSGCVLCRARVPGSRHTALPAAVGSPSSPSPSAATAQCRTTKEALTLLSKRGMNERGLGVGARHADAGERR